MWKPVSQTPIFQFLDRLIRVHKKALRLKALQQAHRGILYMKSAAYTAKRSQRG
jgi:hypothetical protein